LAGNDLRCGADSKSRRDPDGTVCAYATALPRTDR
jgi:hypothetical protein